MSEDYPDCLYRDALQKPTGAYDAAKLRRETIAIAQDQDRKLPTASLEELVADLGTLTAHIESVNKSARYLLATQKPPLEPSRIATPAELAYLASFGPNPPDPQKSRHPMMAEADRLEGKL